MMQTDELVPIEIILHKRSRTLEVVFTEGVRFILPCEYLRVFSPSAEVRGHGGNRPAWVEGKEHVNILAIEPVGHYAIKPIFSDGHSSGIYSWQALYTLGTEYQANWDTYLNRK